MTDASASSRHGIQDLVRMLDIILNDSEWMQLVNTIRQTDRERQRTRKNTD